MANSLFVRPERPQSRHGLWAPGPSYLFGKMYVEIRWKFVAMANPNKRVDLLGTRGRQPGS
jgi:hypothetical protein